VARTGSDENIAHTTDKLAEGAVRVCVRARARARVCVCVAAIVRSATFPQSLMAATRARLASRAIDRAHVLSWRACALVVTGTARQQRRQQTHDDENEEALANRGRIARGRTSIYTRSRDTDLQFEGRENSLPSALTLYELTSCDDNT